MNHRKASPLLALLACALPCAGALAQGFSSVSSAPPAVAAPTPAPASQPTSTPTPPPAVPVATAPAAFSSAAPSQTTSTPLPEPPAAAPVSAPAAPTVARSAGGFERADKVLVRKGERRLYLLRQNQIIAEFPVRLGLNPTGPKQREGDFRTPEGVYQVVRRNPRSEFFLALQVSYPNDSDMRHAKRTGVRPGGLIMIHGLPNVPRKPVDYYARNDWTDGCIAVSNSDMVDIWLRTGVGTTIEIRP